MEVRCTKCRFKFNAMIPVDGGHVEFVCPRCGNRFEISGEPNYADKPIKSPKVQTVDTNPISMPRQAQATSVSKQSSAPPAKKSSQPVPHQPQSRAITIPVNDEDSGKKYLTPILIGVIFGLLVVCAFLFFRSNSDKANSQTPSAEYTQGSSAPSSTPVEDVAPSRDVPANDDVTVKNQSESYQQFSPSFTSSGVGNFCELPFIIESQLQCTGLSIENFQDMLIRGTCKSGNNMIMYEHSDGVRYQFFFDESPYSSTALLTGIAISRQVSSPYEACMQMDDKFEWENYSNYGSNRFYSSNTGLVFSPGYKGKRVYCYIYMPNAPNKEAAPRG